ncbi:hypothetical protein [Limnohabitans sp. 2KL-51]|uniref:hypothetical protein n=1 Tax=Limnohabitans sp. 2KL-51 TaxID=1977911 RepID=UPI0018EE4FD7|nr:hypothetical protein [Limnohabitans sp. 2KL-51]
MFPALMETVCSEEFSGAEWTRTTSPVVFSERQPRHRAMVKPLTRNLFEFDMQKMMRARILIAAFLAMPLMQGCTVLAIADVAASTVIYGVKTVVNVVDAVTPDIINRDKDKNKKKD